MSKRFVVTFEKPAASSVQYVARPSSYRTWLSLLLLVAVVGAASVLAWYGVERSVETRASRGEPKALYVLGKRYFDTAMSRRDYNRAARLIVSAASKGDVAAQTAMGLLYQHGLGVAKDNQQAIRWLRRAADQGYAVAQNELGVMYATGLGTPRDLSQSVKWCALAAAQGSEVAKRNLLLARSVTTSSVPQLTTTTKRSYDQAVVRKVDFSGVTISFQPVPGGLGMAKVKIEELPSELRQICKCAEGNSQPGSAFSQLTQVSSTL